MDTLTLRFPALPDGWIRRSGWIRDPFDGAEVSLIQNRQTSLFMLQSLDGTLRRVPEEWARMQIDPAA